VVIVHGLPFIKGHYSNLPVLAETFMSNGYLAVGFFFVLSGFILSYTYEGQIEGPSNRVRFWQARIARIYPVYVLSLALAYWFERSMTLGAATSVLFMVQAWIPWKQWSGAWNYPAWSLSSEALFYLCFPFVLPWMSRRNKATLYVIVGVLLTICVVGHTIVVGLGETGLPSGARRLLPLPIVRIPEFLLGAVLGLVFLRKGESRHHPVLTCLSLLGIVALLSVPLGKWVSLVIVPFAALVYELAKGRGLIAQLFSTKLMTLLGGASYSIYILQYPVRSWVRVLSALISSSAVLWGVLFTPFILVCFSVFIFLFWEEPSRKALRRLFAAGKQRVEKIVPVIPGK
jgi:peptidoglycan/LPS O-acetylase OafA/YrhL